jgi:hypothetical protein
MPRKEGPSIEERMQRAKELFEFKEKRKQKNLQELYASGIYKLARKTSIVFLWISQLILIDWVLPYKEDSDKITGVTINTNTISLPNKEIFLKTKNGYNFKVELPSGIQKPSAGDTIIVYKSFLLHDFKKVNAVATKESFLITSAITYKFIAYLLIGFILAAMFVFVKNIEVEVFAWIVSIYTSFASLFFLFYIIAGFL